MNINQYLEHLANTSQISQDLVCTDPQKRPTGRRNRPLSATKQLLLKAGISAASTGDAFFTDSNNRVLFPLFLSDAYYDFEKINPKRLVVGDLVSVRTGVTGRDYTANMIAPAQEFDLEPGMVEEGTEAEWYVIKDQTRSIRLRKRLRGLKASYESLQFSRLDVMAVRIRKLARALDRSKVKDALEVVVNGDGNLNPSQNTPTAGANWTFGDVVDFHMECIDLSDMDPSLLIGDSTEIGQIAKLSQWTSDGATARGADFRDTGMWAAPLGMDLKIPPKGANVLTGAKKTVAFDQSIGIEEVYVSSMSLVEEDKLIASQFNRIVFTEMTGYAKPDVDTARTKTRP
jgi:hypothetical protein